MCEFAAHFVHGFCDKDKDKLVRKEDLFPLLIQFLQSEDPQYKIGFENYLFDLCDVDENKALDITEFLHLMKCLEIFESQKGQSKNLTTMMALFRAIDSDGNASLSAEEITKALDKLPNDSSVNEEIKSAVKKIKEYCGLLGGREINEMEFLGIVIPPSDFQQYNQQVFSALFEKGDKDHSGMISVKELKTLFKQMYPDGVDERKAPEIIIKLLDETGKGEIDKNQFATFACAVAGNDVTIRCLTKTRFYEAIFKILDSDKSGLLERDETTKLLKSMGLNEKKIAKWFEKIGEEPLTLNKFLEIYLKK
ncbi:EF-hand calcium-binding domain containing protein [Entamoeba histolytica HM-1:IMSS-B]|uniref:EF-hand calcium-binding domain containing protein n=6 Tax=Entamoeba histolytica TaxID=5759 RepID=B1N2G5_ENTH1|nr:EF-hand calcium-binding domain containing protein [Entamoeba histolytica HM-1:IMSS]EMD44204.1 EF hand calcium-binding domain containing protein [Entamoeba histolytica KU27]EMH76726.1 EF-hand calcium-binding domain containing protein [Entamoeba histolytica HM-1:IMSS-B]EMS13064.1 EF-hand calcium-binding domain containing protein [Entamoeba histolytica HM-3:IMSS]ENY65666.1 EF-hand calcium-binding domain containing protein [Entamoeba histolytica HM-1:IMSS-A]GAT91721.1 EF-hand calcium-binding do|eukprot:XP_001913381.1 EF-hand calcium-binding domain containing protein [Entamoeba histolytica HM-1:IMSS]